MVVVVGGAAVVHGASCGGELGRDRHGELAVRGGWHERLRHMAHGLGLELKPTLYTHIHSTGEQVTMRAVTRLRGRVVSACKGSGWGPPARPASS